MDLSPLSNLGKEPVSADEPVGHDVRYDPLFDLLQAEIDRGSLPAVAGAVDWAKVIALAAEILRDKAKDLQVASYLAVGLVQTGGVEGMALALDVYCDLLEQYGSRIFPQRSRARQRAVGWWLEKSKPALMALKGTAVEPARLAQMETALAKLRRLLSELLQETVPLGVVRDFLNSLTAMPQVFREAHAREEPAGGGPPETGEPSQSGEAACVGEMIPLARTSPDGAASPLSPARTVSRGGGGSAAAPAGGPAPAAVPAAIRSALDELFRRLRETAAVLRDQEIRNPLAYRLARQASWLAITELPPAADGRSKLAPPSQELRDRFAATLTTGDPGGLVREVEAQLGQQIFWLDLNRLSVEGLAGIEGAQAASTAVCQETAALVRRLPGLERLSFADGTPFADAATCAWLSSILAGGRAPALRAATRPGAPLPGAALPGGIKPAEAEPVIAGGELFDTVQSFRTQLRECASGRECLQLRLALCRALLNSERAALALPYLEQALLDIERFGLEEYDPTLALQGLQLAWRAFVEQEGGYFEEKARQALYRIARIDPVEMVRLTEG